MARDRGGNLRRARAAAEAAATLARSSLEAYAAAELRLLIERDLGHHVEALRQARKLVLLHPRDPSARMLLRSVLGCMGAPGPGTPPRHPVRLRRGAPLPRDKDGRLPLYFVRVTDTRGAALAALPPGPPSPTMARGRSR